MNKQRKEVLVEVGEFLRELQKDIFSNRVVEARKEKIEKFLKKHGL